MLFRSERSSHASCLPIFPDRPDQIGVDDSFHDSCCDADGEVQDPESRFEDLQSQECPWVESADEPQADFCRGEEDADEDEGEGGYPSSNEIESAAGTTIECTFARSSLRVYWSSLSFYLEAQDGDDNDRVSHEEHL